MPPVLRSFGLLDVLHEYACGPSAARLVFPTVCAASLRNLVRNAGQAKKFAYKVSAGGTWKSCPDQDFVCVSERPLGNDLARLPKGSVRPQHVIAAQAIHRDAG